jgi:hypothetical protein
MHPRTLLALATLVCAPAPPPGGSAPTGVPGPRDEAPEVWFERLGSGSATEREAAQRWLGMHLEPRHFPLLAARARGADPEMARRLSLALAAEERHLGLVVLLLGESEPELAALGERAFEELVTRWCPGATAQPAPRGRVQRLLEQRSERSFAAAARHERLELTFDRLSRLGDLGLPLVLAPGVADSEVRVAAKEGRALEHLAQLCADNGLTFCGVGEWDGEEPGAGAWLLVTPISGALSKSGATRLASWCSTLERGGPGGAAAARALGATGWPAALEWMDARWAGRRDGQALEGLLAAAAFGRVGRSLQRAGERDALLARADEALNSLERKLDQLEEGRGLDADPAQRFAERVARALVGAGPLTLGGEDRSASWLAAWESLGQAQRWLRLAILEGQRGGGLRVREFLRAQVERPRDLPAALRYQALRALAAAPQPTPSGSPVTELGELLEWALQAQLERELLVLLDAAGLEPELAQLGRGPGQRLFALRWLLRVREHEGAARQLAQCAAQVSRPERAELVEALSDARLEFGPRFLEEVAERALAAVAGEADRTLLEVCLLAGCLGAGRQRALFAQLAGETQLEAAEFEWLGALAAGPVGAQAREALLAALAAPPPDAFEREGLARGLDRAVRALDEAGLDEEREALTQAVWRAVAEARSPLHLRLKAPGWPRPRPALVFDLARLERELPRGLR